MELFEAVLLSLLINLTTGLLSAAAAALVQLFAVKLVVAEMSQVSALDRILAETGWCSARRVTPGRLPADGVHFAFLGGPVLAVRRSEARERGGHDRSYTVYALSHGAAELVSRKLMGDPRDVSLRYVYVPAPWRCTSVSQRCPPPPQAYQWQAQGVQRILAAYGGTAGPRASVIVFGKPGVGKSTLGELVAVELMRDQRVRPEVVKNLDLTAKGLLLEDAYCAPNANSPVILMLDEFDSTVDHAEEADTGRSAKKEGASLSDTPAALLGTLDRLNRTPYLIVIATTNRAESAWGGNLARYIRRGRFDLRLAASKR